jgi:hypothetical protein
MPEQSLYNISLFRGFASCSGSFSELGLSRVALLLSERPMSFATIAANAARRKGPRVDAIGLATGATTDIKMTAGGFDDGKALGLDLNHTARTTTTGSGASARCSASIATVATTS